MSSGEDRSKMVPLCQRIKEKQRVCAEKTKTQVQKLSEVIQKATQELENCQPGQEAALLEQMRKEVQKSVSTKTVENTTREFHKSISNFKEKVIDADFAEDLCESIQDNKLNLQILNQIIVEHFYREMDFEIGDILAQEAGLENIQEIRQGYVAMHQVLKDLQTQKVDSALEFVQNNRKNIQDQDIIDKFEFSLHELKFFSLFQSENINFTEIINYVRTHFAKFMEKYPEKVQKLMGYFIKQSFLIQNNKQFFDSKNSPYDQYFQNQEINWMDVQDQFIRLCCVVLNQSYKSPLLVTVAAGSVALPQIAKQMKKIVHMKKLKGMPLEIDLGEEFMFHSIFACPVSKEQSTPNNSPMMLPCGHVLCEDSINNITSSNSRPFKCPYCPSETTAQNCRKLFFPVVR